MNEQALNWLHRNHPELARYNNQWIAASEGGVVISNSRLEDVLQELRAADIASLVFAYITFDTWQ